MPRPGIAPPPSRVAVGERLGDRALAEMGSE